MEITSQNHGFVVTRDSLPAGVVETHVSLFDGSLEGLRVEGRPVFSVQYHPEASPGPKDSHYLFARFIEMMERKQGEPPAAAAVSLQSHRGPSQRATCSLPGGSKLMLV